MRQGLEIHRADDDFEAGGVEVEEGDYIVRADQPFRTGAPRLVRNDLPRVQLQFSHGMSVTTDAMLLAVTEEDRGAIEEIRVVVDWLQALAR